MIIPHNIIINADDIGLNPSVNQAILFCFKEGYINSTSLLTNMNYFDDAVSIIHNNPSITNVGVHINFAEGKPVTSFRQRQFLDADGNWNLARTGKLLHLLSAESKRAFSNELKAQIERAISGQIKISHLDSHLHLHTLPAFYDLFIDAAKTYQLKLRLAQTYNEGNYAKYSYRKYLNGKIRAENNNYTEFFETVDEFFKKPNRILNGNKVEIMVHPDFDASGKLYDHVDGTSINKWITYLNA